MKWTLWYNIKQVLISFDQMIRCILACFICLFKWQYKGYADETLSAYAWRMHGKYWYANYLRIFIDCLMYVFEGCKWLHCKGAYESEQKRLHLPPEER